jgi:hypothetical protein
MVMEYFLSSKTQILLLVIAVRQTEHKKPAEKEELSSSKL